MAARMIVCGQDRLVVRMVEELGRLGELVVVVLERPAPEVEQPLAQAGIEVVTGSPLDPVVLRAAGIERARALALVGEGDKENLHAALVAHDLNPGLRLVVRMFNQRLGQRIGELFDDCAVLSASAIAAPFFVDAALGDGRARTISVGARGFSVGPPDAVGVPALALAGRGEDGRTVLLPAGGRPTVVLGEPLPVRAHPVRRARGRLRRVGAVLSRLVDLRLRLALAALAALVMVGTVLFKLGLRLGWAQSLYFTVTTVTTTGYGDINLNGARIWLQVAGISVMVLGVLVVALLTAAVVDSLVAARLVRALGPPVGSPEHHVVVCGLGTVGLRVSEQLRSAGVEVVAVESAPTAATLATARRLGVPVVAGSAGEPETLAAAGVARARCVVAVTDDDVTNLEAGLTARSLRGDIRVVLRLYDADLADRVDRRLGLAVSGSVSFAAAPVFAAAMLGRRVLAALPVGRRVLLVAAVPVGAGSPLDGADLATVDSGEARVLGVQDGDAEPVWRPTGPLAAGQTVYLVATRDGLATALLTSGAHVDTEPPGETGR